MAPRPLTREFIIEAGESDYRYELNRTWSVLGGGPVCTFIMLNPSTADEFTNDPTIRRCIDFSNRFGCVNLNVINLFAIRLTHPCLLFESEDPVGPYNNRYINAVLSVADGPVVAAWGTHGHYMGRDAYVMNICKKKGLEVSCLGVTKEGFPRHPLYLHKRTPLEPYTWEW